MVRSRRLPVVVSALCLLVLVAVAVMPGLIGRSHAAAASGGITVTPALIQMTITPGSSQITANFDVTNNYAQPITLGFALEPDTAKGATLTATQVSTFVTLASSALTLQPGQSKRQTVTLTDDSQLPPGSQALQLSVIQQAGDSAGSASVGIAGRMVLPVTLVKQAGAVSSYTVSSLTTAASLMSLPHQATVQLTNTGNTVVIPRGTVVVTDPGGTVVAQGVLNETSLALSPKGTLTLDTPLTGLAAARWPGPYKTTVRYGLGGVDNTQHFTMSAWYIAWWHIALVLLVVGLTWYGKQHVRQLQRKFQQTLRLTGRIKPKRAITARGGN